MLNMWARHLTSHNVDVVLFLFLGVGFGVGFASVIVVKWVGLADGLVHFAELINMGR